MKPKQLVLIMHNG